MDKPLPTSLLVVPQTRLKLRGDRAFVVVAPKLWNELPLQIRQVSFKNSPVLFADEVRQLPVVVFVLWFYFLLLYITFHAFLKIVLILLTFFVIFAVLFIDPQHSDLDYSCRLKLIQSGSGLIPHELNQHRHKHKSIERNGN